ncbi:MAG: porin family protein [Gammaproteobacteria bacterium]|nr:MAG: porin family protein [Gammaproteobacteria bacterium]
MKSKSSWLVAFLTSILVFPQLVNASETRGYFGFSFGSSDDEVLNETESGFKLVLGASLSDNLAVEGAFVDLGTINYGFAEISQYGIAGNLIGKIPVGDAVSLFAKAGLFSWTFEVDYGYIAEDTGVDITYGAGLEVKLTDKASLLGEYESFEVSDGDVSLVSLGFRLYFR